MSADADSVDMKRFAEIYSVAFGTEEEPSEYTIKMHVTPLPDQQVRNEAAIKQLRWKLNHGAKGFKAVIEGGEQDGKIVGFSIWHPPGVAAGLVFESTDKDKLEDADLKDMMQPMNLESWNQFYGACQGMCDKHHQDENFW